MSRKEKFGLVAAIISLVSSALVALSAIMFIASASTVASIFSEIFAELGFNFDMGIEMLIIGMGVFLLLFSVPVLILSAIFCKKRKSQGLAITLLVFNCIWMNILAIGFLIAYLCIKDEPQPEPEQSQLPNPF